LVPCNSHGLISILQAIELTIRVLRLNTGMGSWKVLLLAKEQLSLALAYRYERLSFYRTCRSFCSLSITHWGKILNGGAA
jgi:hypothetical protein